MVYVEKKKMGRPTQNPKTIVKRARISIEDAEKLKESAEKMDKTESEILRLGISEIYNKLKK